MCTARCQQAHSPSAKCKASRLRPRLVKGLFNGARHRFASAFILSAVLTSQVNKTITVVCKGRRKRAEANATGDIHYVIFHNPAKHEGHHVCLTPLTPALHTVCSLPSWQPPCRALASDFAQNFPFSYRQPNFAHVK